MAAAAVWARTVAAPRAASGSAALGAGSRTYRVRIPHEAGSDLGWLYGHAEIINREEADDEAQILEIRVEPRHNQAFAQRFADRITE